ncbi:MAG: hypothetical protein ACRCX8_11400 [Sarcina sp.]
MIGFNIVCLSCGSGDISIVEEIDYDYEEVPCTIGHCIKCNFVATKIECRIY